MKSKSNFLLLVVAICFSAFAMLSCESVPELPIDNKLTAEDLTIDVMENESLGNELGQISATSEGALLKFELISSEPADAISISSGTGVVSVADADAFDYERNTSMTAKVRVTAGSDEREINVLIRLQDELPTPGDLNRIKGSWRVNKFSYNGVFAMIGNHECRLDDKMSINGDGSYIYNGGSELCGNEDNLQIKEGTWDLDEHLKFVLFDKGEDNEFNASLEHFENGKLALGGTWMGSSVSGEFITE